MTQTAGKRSKKTIVAIALLTMVLLCAMAMPAAAYSYNRQAAADYAYNNAYNGVPGSWYFGTIGGDCTNFVSHSLQAGGWRENNAGQSSDHSWYYNYAPQGYSYSWSGSHSLYRFMYYNLRATAVSDPNQLQIGDVIQIDYQDDGFWDHSMIVTGKDSRGLLISQHTTDRRNYPLSEIYNRVNEQYPGYNHRYEGWHIKDYYTY